MHGRQKSIILSHIYLNKSFANILETWTNILGNDKNINSNNNSYKAILVSLVINSWQMKIWFKHWHLTSSNPLAVVLNFISSYISLNVSLYGMYAKAGQRTQGAPRWDHRCLKTFLSPINNRGNFLGREHVRNLLSTGLNVEYHLHAWQRWHGFKMPLK